MINARNVAEMLKIWNTVQIRLKPSAGISSSRFKGLLTPGQNIIFKLTDRTPLIQPENVPKIANWIKLADTVAEENPEGNIYLAMYFGEDKDEYFPTLSRNLVNALIQAARPNAGKLATVCLANGYGKGHQIGTEPVELCLLLTALQQDVNTAKIPRTLKYYIDIGHLYSSGTHIGMFDQFVQCMSSLDPDFLRKVGVFALNNTLATFGSKFDRHSVISHGNAFPTREAIESWVYSIPASIPTVILSSSHPQIAARIISKLGLRNQDLVLKSIVDHDALMVSKYNIDAAYGVTTRAHNYENEMYDAPLEEA